MPNMFRRQPVYTNGECIFIVVIVILNEVICRPKRSMEKSAKYVLDRLQSSDGALVQECGLRRPKCARRVVN